MVTERTARACRTHLKRSGLADVKAGKSVFFKKGARRNERMASVCASAIMDVPHLWAQVDDVDLTKKKVHEATVEILFVNWGIIGLDRIKGSSIAEWICFVDQVHVYWILQRDPQHACVPAGSNDKIEITLVPRR